APGEGAQIARARGASPPAAVAVLGDEARVAHGEGTPGAEAKDVAPRPGSQRSIDLPGGIGPPRQGLVVAGGEDLLAVAVEPEDPAAGDRARLAPGRPIEMVDASVAVAHPELAPRAPDDI